MERKIPFKFLVSGLAATVALCAMCTYFNMVDFRSYELFSNKDLAIVSLTNFVHENLIESSI